MTEDGPVKRTLVGRGSIQVDVHRVLPLLPTDNIPYHWSQEQRSIHEKAKKALLTHSVMYALWDICVDRDT